MGLKQDILSEPVSELELRPVLTASGDMTVREAVAKMRHARLGYMVLLDDQDRPVHMFTERMMIKILLEGRAALDRPLTDFYYKPADRIGRGEPIAKLIQMMHEGDLRFVCVVDEAGKCIGVTGQKGVMEYIADHFPRQVKVQTLEPRLFIKHREGA